MARSRRRMRRGGAAAKTGVAPRVRSVSLLADEAIGIIIGAAGVFLLFSLLSTGHALSGATGAAVPTANWGGLVGHWVASNLLNTFGSGAFLLVGLVWQAAFLTMTHASPQQRILASLGGGLLVIGLSPILHLSLPQVPAFMGEGGGLVGRRLSTLLAPYCNTGGTLLIGAVIVVLGSMLLGRAVRPLVSSSVATCCQLWRTTVKTALARLGRGVRGLHRRPRAALKLPPTVIVEPALSPVIDIPVSAVRSVGDPLELMPPATSVSAQRPPTDLAGVTSYDKPPLTLFNLPVNGKRHGDGIDLTKQAKILEGKLGDFGVDGRVVQVLPGPVVTMYEFEPASGIKVSRIVNLADDLALGMKALSVRIVAPVPGKSVVGIEIPNPHREPVFLREILASPAFQEASSKLVLALGKDILGASTVTDLAQIPHLLIAGATGSGKSVGLNSMICSILINTTPDEVKFIMIDPKMLELSVYDGIPHLIAPVVTHPKKAAAALHWAVEEMERRYRLLAEHGVRGIDGYNQAHPEQRLPYVVVVIDELADLMLVARRDVEDSLTRLAQMARAAGIHLLVATQRPSVDVLTGIIKANFPARISFQVSSRTDSRTILDSIGAERLLGKGDMLFLPPGTSKLLRIHGAYVSEAEIKRLVEQLQTQQAPVYDFSIFTAKPDESAEPEAFDDKYDEAVALVSRVGQASASLIQRHLRIGYNRAARLIEVMEREGVVGPADGSRPREVYVKEIPGSPFRS
jgi:S-DNA-T family DNA segregation ATPase FtsK/SpoIIIE